jgi:hypothetical protein
MTNGSGMMMRAGTHPTPELAERFRLARIAV